MTGFSQTDFENDELRMKLVVVLNDLNKKPILTKYSSLSKREQRLYNESLNSYITSKLGGDNYLKIIENDFNEIVNEYFDSSGFKWEEAPIQNLNSISIELTKDDDLDTKLTELEEKHSQILLDERC